MGCWLHDVGVASPCDPRHESGARSRAARSRRRGVGLHPARLRRRPASESDPHHRARRGLAAPFPRARGVRFTSRCSDRPPHRSRRPHGRSIRVGAPLAEWRRSGLTAAEFCRGRDFAVSTLRWYSSSLGEIEEVDEVDETPEPAFAKIEVRREHRGDRRAGRCTRARPQGVRGRHARVRVRSAGPGDA